MTFRFAEAIPPSGAAVVVSCVKVPAPLLLLRNQDGAMPDSKDGFCGFGVGVGVGDPAAAVRLTRSNDTAPVLCPEQSENSTFPSATVGL